MFDNILSALLIAAQSLDVGSTAGALNRGCVEAVWPTQNIYVMGGVKAAATGTLLVVVKRKKGIVKKVAITGAILGITSGFVGGIHNLNTYCGPR